MITNPPTHQESGADVLSPTRNSRLGFLIFAVVIIPLACILFDPVVFRVGSLAAPAFHEPILWRWQPFAYVAVLLSILLITIYRLPPKLPPAGLSLVGGAFAASSLLSFALGCYLLPTSFIGLFILAGIFGFSPFLTSLAYFGAARRIYREILLVRSRRLAVIGLLTGAAIYISTVYSFHIFLDRRFTAALNSAADGQIGSLPIYCHVFGDYRLLRAYEAERSEPRQQHLAAAFQQLTGLDINARLNDFND